jgi:dolichol kinase
MTGATYICASSLICAVVFRNQPHIAAIVLGAFIWGDAIAALVGQSIGKIKIGKKSMEGSIACFALCMAMFLLLFPAAPGLLDAWGKTVPLPLAIIASFCITIMELFPLRLGSFTINDNLTVPVVTGAVMMALFPLL